MAEESLTKYLAERRQNVDEAIISILEDLKIRIPTVLYEPIKYSLTSGGKRLRPILCLSAYSLFRGDWKAVLPFAASIEFIHTYSLIHDDLPSMDDDDYRRGVPACHKVFGEAKAILAGDALLTEAFRIFMEVDEAAVNPERKIRAARVVALAAGAAGMVAGQALDLEAHLEGGTEEEIREIHSLKTGALFKGSVLSGAILGGAGEDDLSCLSEYGEKVGLAFQIVDDILDVTSSFAELGKETGKDVRMGKATYPATLGVEKSLNEAERLIEEGKKSLLILGERKRILAEIAGLCLKRRN